MHCLIYTNYTDTLMCIYIRFIINTYTNMICIKEDYTVIVIQAQTILYEDKNTYIYKIQ